MQFSWAKLKGVPLAMLIWGASVEVRAEVLQMFVRGSDDPFDKVRAVEQKTDKKQTLKVDPRVHAEPSRVVKQTDSDMILHIEGALSEGDRQLDDSSLYDLHMFEGQAGKIVRITLVSDEFDAFLLFQNATGEELARNDDANNSRNSEIVIRLTSSGEYRILANALDESSTGIYELTVTNADEALLAKQELQREASQFLQRGIHSLQTGNFQEALGLLETALRNYRNIENYQGEADSLGVLGVLYENLGYNYRAIENHEQQLEIVRNIGDKRGEANALVNIGNAHFNLSNYQKAIEFHTQSLAIARDISYLQGEANALGNIGNAYFYLSEYAKTIEFLSQTLTIARANNDHWREADALGNMAVAYLRLGDYEQSINLSMQKLSIAHDIGDQQGEADAMRTIGAVHTKLGNYDQSIDFYQKALAIDREIGDMKGEAASLGGLGGIYRNIGNYERAIEFHQQSLVASRVIEDLQGEALSLGNLGIAHSRIGDYHQAVDFYQQSLVISQEIGDRQSEALSLSYLGDVWKSREQIEIATIFYKKSVNIFETIRRGITELEPVLQNTYITSIENPYRSLIDILLEQGRILEAQQVLELLKVEELREFTRATYTSGQLQYDPIEQTVADSHGTLINLGVKISTCDPNCDQNLYDQQIVLEAAFDETVETFEATIRANRTTDDVFYDPDSLASDALDIVNAQDGTVLIYPVVLEDTLWLLWTATGGVVGSVEVPEANQADISRAVVRFRELLTRRDSQSLPELKQVGQQLHSWLIEPLSTELDQNDIQHLVFAQDRATRYLPMAALHDGRQFLLENYTISTVLSAALTDTADRLGVVESASALGLGLDQSKEGFSALPNVREELQGVIRESETDPTGIYPGNIFMNEDFTFATLREQVRRHRILHIATHAEFIPNIKDASYILSGTGEQLTIDQIGSLDIQFNNLHLVVLSACQTALGGESLDGTEIAGVSSYFLGKNKAEAVLATLWRVDDAGTSLLMQRFYEFMATGELTKAEALRQAQLSLLNGEVTLDERFDNLGIERGGLISEIESSSPTATLDHPYYWAPFILIGNSL